MKIERVQRQTSDPKGKVASEKRYVGEKRRHGCGHAAASKKPFEHKL
jgi:hypothetical protein